MVSLSRHSSAENDFHNSDLSVFKKLLGKTEVFSFRLSFKLQIRDIKDYTSFSLPKEPIVVAGKTGTLRNQLQQIVHTKSCYSMEGI